MTMARERKAGSCYFISRRTHEGVYRLRPDPAVTNAVGYIVALACVLYGVEIVSFCAMSNHYHATVHDRFGRLADWETFVNGQLARYLNTIHERDSHVWSASEGNAIEIATPGHKFIEKTAYTLANPTKAGLVYAPTAWPGLYIGVEALRRRQRLVFTRPEDYFDAAGRLPAEVELTPLAPPGWEHDEFCDEVEVELAHRDPSAKPGCIGVPSLRDSSPEVSRWLDERSATQRRPRCALRRRPGAGKDEQSGRERTVWTRVR